MSSESAPSHMQKVKGNWYTPSMSTTTSIREAKLGRFRTGAVGNEFAVGRFVVAVYGGDGFVCGDCGGDSGDVGDGAG